jgi:hypothetical protein
VLWALVKESLNTILQLHALVKIKTNSVIVSELKASFQVLNVHILINYT